MTEAQLRDLLGAGMPKIATASVNAVYPLGFQAMMEPPRDYAVESQVVGSQLLYTRNFQVCSFLIMEAGHIFKLGLRVFPKFGRMDATKRVVSTNSEVLNTVISKLGHLLRTSAGEEDVVTAPPIVLNCSGASRILVQGSESRFLKLANADLSFLIIASIQQV
jgi:hypothetical protein